MCGFLGGKKTNKNGQPIAEFDDSLTRNERPNEAIRLKLVQTDIHFGGPLMAAWKLVL